MFSLTQRAAVHPPPALVLAHAPKADDSVPYFAFGSNMAPSVLTGRRGCNPLVSRAARAPGWCLTFGLAAVPYLEPGMGTILRRGDPGTDGRPEAVGVVHMLSRSDFMRVLITEGAPDGGESEGSGYLLIEVEVDYLDGEAPKRGKALTLTTKSDRLRPNALPSRRYLNLLLDGAKHHALPADYTSWLESHDHFRPTAAKKAARVVFMAFFLTVGLPIFFFSRLLDGLFSPGSLPVRAAKRAQSMAWGMAAGMEGWVGMVAGSGWHNG
ncbi:hypothetical protein DFJ74DRAFT_774657 [Hyaloraphidium curvatum]|nr:hypothetical protein DFJ74DRAFT_774657 [Hyaloraphidium curvatum]